MFMDQATGIGHTEMSYSHRMVRDGIIHSLSKVFNTVTLWLGMLVIHELLFNPSHAVVCLGKRKL